MIDITLTEEINEEELEQENTEQQSEEIVIINGKEI